MYDAAQDAPADGKSTSAIRRLEKSLMARQEPVFKERRGRRRCVKYKTAPLDPSLLLDLPAFGEDIDAAAQEEPAPIADAPRGWHATHHDLGHGVTGTRWRRPRSQVHPDLANTCSDYRASAFVPPAPVESAETIRYDSAAAAATASLFPPQAEVWALSGYPGYVLLRGALSPATQLALCCDVLLQLCDAPAATNHARSMGLLPPGLFRAAREGRVLAPGQTCCAWGGCPGCGGCQDGLGGHVGDGRGAGSESGTDGDPLQLSRETGTSPWHWCEPGCPSLAAMGSRDTEAGVTEGDREPPSSPSPDPAPSSSPASSSLPPGSGTQASSLLSRLRWSTLGPTYDWGRRVYLKDSPCMPLPPFLARLAAEAVGLCGVLAGGDGVGGGCGVDRDEEGRACEGFRPDAAIVNYYRQHDTLMAHQDDAERDLTQPLVALSLGCDAVFVLGGSSRDDPAVALRLRSGDVVVMSGPARMAFHGVPRVMTEEGCEGLRRAVEGGCEGEGMGARDVGENDDKRHEMDSADATYEAPGSSGWSLRERRDVAEYMQGCRINISVRSVT